MELKDRIAELIKYKDVSASSFATAIGTKTKQAIYELLKGNTKSLSQQMTQNILAYIPELNMQWLLTGEGEMLKSQAEPGKAKTVPDDDFLLVPVVHIDSVGGMHSSNDINTPEYIERYIPMTGARPGDVAIYQSGNSMIPAIPSGALLLIREVETWREYIGYGDVFVLLLCDDRRITKEIRRYEQNPNEYFWCVSYNPDVADEELPKRMVARVWKVIKVLVDKGW